MTDGVFDFYVGTGETVEPQDNYFPMNTDTRFLGDPPKKIKMWQALWLLFWTIGPRNAWIFWRTRGFTRLVLKDLEL